MSKPKVVSKYLFEIASELRIDLVRRSPAGSYSFIILSIGVIFSGLGSATFKGPLAFIGSVALVACIWRIYLSKRMVKKPELVTNKNLKIHNIMILVNASCFAMIFSLINFGNPQQSLAFILSTATMCAVLIGGVSSLSPAPRTQMFFFVTNSLLPCVAIFLRWYVLRLDAIELVYPILYPTAFVYSYIQSKQFRKHLIERYEYEFTLKDERDHLQSVLDAVPGFIIYLDKSLKITSITAGLEKKFDNALAVGDSLDTGKFAFTRAIQKFRDSEVSFMTREICLHAKSGNEWFLISLKKIDHGQSMVVVGASIDELRKVREDLSEQTNRAMNASKLAALGELAAGAAHEINNPVAIIHGYLTEMKKLSEKENFSTKEKFLDRLEKGRNTLLRIKKIVSGMQLLSRDAQDDPYSLTPIKAIIEDTLNLCQERFKRHNIDFVLGAVPDTQLECRPTQISQVLLNLINNACDAIEGQEKRNIAISFESEGDAFKIHINDNGAGIPEPIQNRIYDPFFTTKDPGKGTGLGLSICKRIVQEHKGKISYNYNNGARFTLEFPMAAAISKSA